MASVNGVGSKQTPRHARLRRLRVTRPIERGDSAAVAQRWPSVMMASRPRQITCPERLPFERRIIIPKYDALSGLRDMTVTTATVTKYRERCLDIWRLEMLWIMGQIFRDSGFVKPVN